MKQLTLSERGYKILRACVTYCLDLLEEGHEEGARISDPDTGEKFEYGDVMQLDQQTEYCVEDYHRDMLGGETDRLTQEIRKLKKEAQDDLRRINEGDWNSGSMGRSEPDSA